MKDVGMIVFMMIIGAAIGSATNYLAIKMLFRPHEPIYFMKKRLPFTPGLIPKRRGEIATQLGSIVMNHLITADGFKKKLQNATFINELIVTAQRTVREWLQSERTIAQLLQQHVAIKDVTATLERKTEEIIRDKVNEFFNRNRNHRLDDVVPKAWQEKIEVKLPTVAALITRTLKDYVESNEGKKKLSELIEQFLKSKGTFGNMVSMFLGNERLVDKIQPAILKLLDDRKATLLVEQLLEKEWQKLKARRCDDLFALVDEEAIVAQLKRYFIEEVPMYRWLDSPLRSWTKQFEPFIVEQAVPQLVHALIALFANKSEEVLVKLHLDELVREQVERFSLVQLEEVVLSVSRRELKMITYLGGVLGGMIGFVQGLIVIFV